MILCVLQARMGSSRFPGKVLEDIVGRPMLWHILFRLKFSKLLDNVVVATSDKETDDPIMNFCKDEGILCFRGSEEDVLDRFYMAARQFKARHVVRVTGDCPLIDPEVIDKVISTYQSANYDYATNTLRYTYPDGLDVEVFSFNALETAWREAANSAQREHVTPYIRASGKFRVIGVENEQDFSDNGIRLTVDTRSDLELIRSIYKYLFDENRVFLLKEIVELLKKYPELKEVNQDHVMNEGFYISIAREKETMPPVCVNLDKSKNYLDRAKKFIPSQTQTFSKGPTQFVQGVSPGFLARGDGSHVWDVDGNEYIDYILGLGPVILGHNYPAVSEAAIKQLKNGSAFSLPHFLEVELAEVLVDLIPCAEMVRFGKNGSDATTGSVRVARAFTGREKIASCGYHGWHDWHIGSTTRRLGVPESTQRLTLPFEYNNIESLKKIFEENHNEIAAVIMEPVGVIEPNKGFLSQVKEIARKNNALLIFDEVVTGFRIALGGAQEYFGVTPDLACFGKGMGNGFPISAVVGKKDIMKLFDDVFFSFTFGGEAVSLAAAIATIDEMKEKKVVEYIWEQGKRLRDGYNIIAREMGVGHITKCVGFAPRTVMTFHGKDDQEDLILRSLLQQEMVKRGILFLAGNNMCYCHNDGDLEYTLRAYKAALEYIRKAMESGNPRDFLGGPPVKAVFRKA